MSQKLPKPDDPAQHKRFIEMAREVEVDEQEGALDRVFKRIKPNISNRQSRTRSDAKRPKPGA
jgi:hypothetical protein